MTGMECPVCNKPLIVLEYNDVEVDFCVACRGIWLDAGELDLLFGDRRVTEGFLRAAEAGPGLREKDRACPICTRKMRKYTTAGAAPVTYDACPKNDGLWFDAGELQAVLAQGSTAPGGEQVVQWLRDMFPNRPE